MQIASPAHGRARAAVPRADTIFHFAVRPHPSARLRWTLMAAGLVAAAAGYAATVAIVPEALEMHAVALATRGERPVPELVLPDAADDDATRAPSQPSAAVREPKVIDRRPDAPTVSRRRQRSARSVEAHALAIAPPTPADAAPASTANQPASASASLPPPSAAALLALTPTADPSQPPTPPPSAASPAPHATSIPAPLATTPPPSAATPALQHLEPRVQHLLVRGSLPSALIRRALARLQPEFTSCQNARADVATVLASSWHTHAAIDEAGRTRDLEVTGPETARAVSSCLARATARLLVAPPDTGRINASWDLRFEPTK